MNAMVSAAPSRPSEVSPIQRPPQQRFVALEWLRFGLGLYIVLFHTIYHYGASWPWAHYLSDVGFFSTSTFFVLSGFLLTHVYLRPQADGDYRMREPARSFLIKRIANLYPIHIGAIVITALVLGMLAWMGLTPDDAAHASIRFVIYDVNDGSPLEQLYHMLSNAELFRAIVMNLTMLQAWNPYYLTFNAPAWSISTLLFFYICFPWAAPRLHRLRNPLLAIAIVNAIYLLFPLAAIVTHQYGMPMTGILHRNPLVRLPEFLSGILLCTYYHQRVAQGRSLSPMSAVAGAAWVVLNLLAATWLLRLGHGFYYLLHDGLMLSGQLCLLYLCLFIPSPRSERWQRIASRFGGASLPMFALHVPLYLFFSRIEMVLAGRPSLCLQSLRACFGAAGHVSTTWYGLYLLLTVGFCLYFQESVVVPVRQALQKLLLPMPPKSQPPPESSAGQR
ncbi:acyltransferase family protein [Frateuria aurantia]